MLTLDILQAAKMTKRKILAVTVNPKLQLDAEKRRLKRDLIRARFAKQLVRLVRLPRSGSRRRHSCHRSK